MKRLERTIQEWMKNEQAGALKAQKLTLQFELRRRALWSIQELCIWVNVVDGKALTECLEEGNPTRPATPFNGRRCRGFVGLGFGKLQEAASICK